MHASAGLRGSKSWGGIFEEIKAIPLRAPSCLPQEATGTIPPPVAGDITQVSERGAGAECQVVIKYHHRVTKLCRALQAQTGAGGGIARSMR